MGTIHRFTGGEGNPDWEGVSVEAYGIDSGHEGTRRVLIGPKDGAGNFAVRYFEIPSGASSSLDQHRHDHGVFVLRGQGNVRLGEEKHSIGVGDVVYVSPEEIHQFENPGPEPLGFLCVVPPKE